MKPSEKRALREEKLRAASAQEETAEPISEKSEASDKQSSSEVTYKRKEGFFQSHIRLITFIITATLVITVFGPIGIDMLVDKKNNKTVSNKKDMSLDTVYSIYYNADTVKWDNFKNFNYTDGSRDDGKYYVREYPIKDSELVLMVGGSDIGGRPDYVLLVDYSVDGGQIDILKEDPTYFIKNSEESK